MRAMHVSTPCWRRYAIVRASGCGGRELDHGLDVVLFLLERGLPAVERHAAGDQAVEPSAICLGEGFSGLLEMAAVRVDRAEDDVVLQHGRVVKRPNIDA